MNNKNTPDEQLKSLDANDRKLLKIGNSRQLLWPLALFWTAFAINSYRQHGFSWIEGFVVGLWIYSALTELIGIYRRRHR